ncbi:MAG: hypothetical protein CL926_13800 [Deltaproteobacteria bacterium]|nr:hypothetical protein [Deltaproteobacteria bacterium]
MIEILLAIAIFLVVVIFVRSHLSIRRQLNHYIENDFSKQDTWSYAKTRILQQGVAEGHDLERLSERLHQSEASVRSKLVSMKVYDAYLERQVEVGKAKFEEWQKLKDKVGKPFSSEPVETEKDRLAPNWKFVQSLSKNWFDPRIEFCETFYTSTTSKKADPLTQHEVIKHVAAFLNTAGGHVLIGFGKQGKLLGLFDDDLRTMHHYQHRVEETLRKTLGDYALPYIKIHMIKWGSEDVCMVVCEKADLDDSDSEVSCTYQKYNEIMGFEKRQKLIYRRLNAQSLSDPIVVPSNQIAEGD